MSSRDNETGSGRKGQPQQAPDGFSALPTGTRLSERYLIESVIGAGGFGITYLARHEALGKPYAIKEHFPRQFAYRDGVSATVRPSDAPTFRWTLDRFLQEGRSLARCRHPSIVGVADVFEAYDTAYMVLEFEDGSSLGRWLDELDRPPTQDEIDGVLMPILDALAYLHSHDMLHRDIAPDNIIIRRDGKPCLIDFGAARQAIAERSQVMSAIVKAGYSPPEQYTTAGRAQGPWTDIYALAGTVYRALAGKRPTEATERQIDDDLIPIAEAVEYPEDYRPEFLDAIDAGLLLRPSERPQSVADWYEMLGLPGTAPVYLPGGESEPPTASPSTGPGGSRRREGSSRPASVPRSGPRSGGAGTANADPQAIADVGPSPVTSARIAAERDSRLGRNLVVAVAGATLLLFGSNYAGMWSTPGQLEARLEKERQRDGPFKRVEEDRLKRLKQQVEDKERTERLERDRKAQRDEADRKQREAAEKAARDRTAPADPNARPQLADTDCQISKPLAGIVAACSSIISRFNDYAEAYSVRGWALRERNQPERALTDFNRALQLAPNVAATYSQRGLTYLRLKDVDRAIADYNKAIELAPGSAAHINDRGVAFMEINDFKRAIEDFDRAIQIDPRFSLPYNNRARAHARGAKDHVRAIADLDRAIQIDPRFSLAYENRAFSQLDLNEFDKAIADFTKAIEFSPRSARAFNGRGVAYERKGNRALAIADYRRALEANQNNAAARENLTRLGEKL
jgi:serine/threonine protein kinase/tetratricopeptide (TPR) repeat protein